MQQETAVEVINEILGGAHENVVGVPEPGNIPPIPENPQPSVEPARAVEPLVIPKVGFQWIYPEPYRKTVHSKHLEAVTAGTVDPWTIEHIAWGRSTGCQHWACKKSRKEFAGAWPGDPTANNPRPETSFQETEPQLTDGLDAEFFEIFDEEMIAQIADSPNQLVAMRLESLMKAGKLPRVQAALDIWEKTSPKELRIHGQQAKKLLQMYVKLPLGPHKSLILYLAFVAVQDLIKLKKTINLIRKEDGNSKSDG